MGKPNGKYFESTHKCNVRGIPSPIDIDGSCVYFSTENGKPVCRYSDKCDCVRLKNNDN